MCLADTRFWLEEGALHVEDLGSTNGTHLNGKPVARPSRVMPTDQLLVGKVKISFHAGPEGSEFLAGLDTHDQLILALEHEVVRCRTFSRKLCVLLAGTDSRSGHGGIESWYPHLRHALRPVDRVAPYGPNSALVLLPECSVDEGKQIAEAIVNEAKSNQPILLCGLANFPESATSSEALIEAVRKAALTASRRQRVVVAAGTSSPGPDKPLVLSSAMSAVYATARRVAPSRLPVLIFGETGSGKEMIAQAIHRSSGRTGPIRSVNCGAIPRNY